MCYAKEGKLTAALGLAATHFGDPRLYLIKVLDNSVLPRYREGSWGAMEQVMYHTWKHKEASAGTASSYRQDGPTQLPVPTVMVGRAQQAPWLDLLPTGKNSDSQPILGPSFFFFFKEITSYLTVYCLKFFLGHTVRYVELPQPGIEPVPPAVEAQSLNHWTTREVPIPLFKNTLEYPQRKSNPCDLCIKL